MTTFAPHTHSAEPPAQSHALESNRPARGSVGADAGRSRSAKGMPKDGDAESRLERAERLGHDLARIPVRASEGVIQGYFSRPARPGTMAAFMKQNERADRELVAEVSHYLANHNPDLAGIFDGLAAAPSDQGMLDDWIMENLRMTFDQIRLENIRSAHPQVATMPASWISDVWAHNPGGPSIIVNPSPQSSPRPYDFSDSDDEPDRVREEDIDESDMVVNINRDEYDYREQTYPISSQDKSDVRASTMLDNAYLAFREHQGMPRLHAESTSKATVHGTKYEKGEKKGQPRTVADEGARILEVERKRKSYGEKVLSHHPDRVWTQAPHSEMGFHPQTRTANTLEGDGSDLSSRVGRRASLGRMVVRERSGLYSHTFDGRERRKERRDFVEQVEALVESAGGIDATIEDIPAFIDLIDQLLEREEVKPEVRAMGAMLKEILRSAQGAYAEGAAFAIAGYIDQEVLSIETESAGKELIVEIAAKFKEHLPEIEDRFLDDDVEEEAGQHNEEVEMGPVEDDIDLEIEPLEERADELDVSREAIPSFIGIIDDLLSIGEIDQSVVEMGEMLKNVLETALNTPPHGDGFSLEYYIDHFVLTKSTASPGGGLLETIARSFKEHLPEV